MGDGGLISCEINAKELEASGLTHQPSTHACAIRHRREERAADTRTARGSVEEKFMSFHARVAG